MRLTNKVIGEVITEEVGPDVVLLVDQLKKKQNVSEFKLAEDIKIDIKETRNMLYRLYKSNLVSFSRKKDKQKGWYIYYWSFNTKDIKYLFIKHKINTVKKLNDRIKREKNNLFFMCDNRCIRFNFDQGMNFNFKCPECGVLMIQENNSSTIMELEKKIDLLNKEIEKKS
tara:strand:- start:159 stop:668 length:510 start_codon:yes stop_codon:yes gene_type:complete